MQIYHFYVLSASSDPENYRYVGVTSRQSVQERFYGHKYCAMHKNKRILPVHKWMYKHYQNSETILIKEIGSCDETVWQDEEKRLIKEYLDNGYDLLNIQAGGSGVITKEMRDLDGVYRSAKAHKKAIVAIDPTTLQVKFEFESIQEAHNYFGAFNKHTAISNALHCKNKNQIKSYGYYWLFKDEYIKTGISSLNLSSTPRSTQRCIYKFDTSGKLISEYWNVRELVRQKLVSANGLSSAIKHKKLYKGFYWSFDKSIDVSQYHIGIYTFKEYDCNNHFVQQYESLQDISNKYGHNNSYWSLKISNNKPLSNGNTIIKIKI